MPITAPVRARAGASAKAGIRLPAAAPIRVRIQPRSVATWRSSYMFRGTPDVRTLPTGARGPTVLPPPSLPNAPKPTLHQIEIIRREFMTAARPSDWLTVSSYFLRWRTVFELVFTCADSGIKRYEAALAKDSPRNTVAGALALEGMNHAFRSLVVNKLGVPLLGKMASLALRTIGQSPSDQPVAAFTEYLWPVVQTTAVDRILKSINRHVDELLKPATLKTDSLPKLKKTLLVALDRMQTACIQAVRNAEVQAASDSEKAKLAETVLFSFTLVNSRAPATDAELSSFAATFCGNIFRALFDSLEYQFRCPDISSIDEDELTKVFERTLWATHIVTFTSHTQETGGPTLALGPLARQYLNESGILGLGQRISTGSIVPPKSADDLRLITWAEEYLRVGHLARVLASFSTASSEYFRDITI